MNDSPNEAEKIEHVARHGQGEAASPSFYRSLANMSKGSTGAGFLLASMMVRSLRFNSWMGQIINSHD
jgi:hypothetical protein